MTASNESVAFDTPAHEQAADAFAMWVFIGSEAMLFGAILLVFLIGRISYGPAFAAASQRLSLPLGTLNTVVLITSSFAMALAQLFANNRRWRASTWWLAATVLLGSVFLSIKAAEYTMEFREGIAPVLGAPFTYDGPDPTHAEFFFGLYFAMTSLHALHLIGGIVAIAGVLVMWSRATQSSRLRRVRAIGLYWHFVDIVWVFLFPILYLINR
ncbi:cytochrome c oxidase subunit III [Mesorhizobium sp. 113-3-9]|uniref:cytochrome c oxidase subunit 3 n=1 Tax=Mesorhizobium sp. 113-3-9 TaxID=2744517 RepID=UPI001927A624|nr:cytochrome c oxidase subunit 3 [Mesorhizobium sp. 113-3-9]BCG88342.1 cytochrome c oxidase subunit III [Mesorhizobium sp. 113-3-9]